jgi:2-amino-4-hydroxy-6-hydroxymethyldihydropteridine diphosphokinase
VFHEHKVRLHVFKPQRGVEDMSGRLVRVKHKPSGRGKEQFGYTAVTRAYIGLGANLGDREANIRQALELLVAEPGIELVAVSSLRETDPVGYLDQPRFLNGACAVDTDLSPRELLGRLLAVEWALGRERGQGPRFGPRPIDLDLLLFGDETLDEPGLTLPHPRLTERSFVLEPLLELDPDLRLPDGRALRGLLEAGVE